MFRMIPGITATAFSAALVACAAADDPRPADEPLGAAPQSVSITGSFPWEVLPLGIQRVSANVCLTVPGSSLDDNVQLQQTTCATGKNQDFFLVRTSSLATPPVKYQVRTGWNMCMTQSGSTVVQRECSGALNQQWFVDISGLTQNNALRSVAANTCIQPPNTSSGTLMTLGPCSAFPWTFAPDFAYARNVIMPKHSASNYKCLQIPPASMNDGAIAQQFNCAGSTNQHFSFVPDGAHFRIQVSHSGKCLAVPGANPNNNVSIQQFACQAGVQSQKWSLTAPEGEGDTFQIQNLATSKCLDIGSSSQADAATLQQFTCNNGSNQRFRVGGYTDKHVQLVRLARGLPCGGAPDANPGIRGEVSDAQMARSIAMVNAVYAPAGIRLRYDPAVDKADLNCTPLYENVASQDLGNLFSAAWPGKVVVYVSGTNCQNSCCGKKNFFGHLPDHRPDAPCEGDCAGDRDEHFAHEFGHMIGLSHVQGGAFTSECQALAACGGSHPQCSGFFTFGCTNPSVFDGDGLIGTPPEPFWGRPHKLAHCNDPADTFQWTLGNMTVRLDNPLGYFHHVTKRITWDQRIATRASVYGRGWD